jgi:hypothetical protein
MSQGSVGDRVPDEDVSLRASWSEEVGVSDGAGGGVSSPGMVGRSSGVMISGCLENILGYGKSFFQLPPPVGMALVVSSRRRCSSTSLAHAARLV